MGLYDPFGCCALTFSQVIQSRTLSCIIKGIMNTRQHTTVTSTTCYWLKGTCTPALPSNCLKASIRRVSHLQIWALDRPLRRQPALRPRSFSFDTSLCPFSISTACIDLSPSSPTLPSPLPPLLCFPILDIARLTTFSVVVIEPGKYTLRRPSLLSPALSASARFGTPFCLRPLSCHPASFFPLLCCWPQFFFTRQPAPWSYRPPRRALVRLDESFVCLLLPSKQCAATFRVADMFMPVEVYI
ncbi:unnamed protein product [Protopolystoma xenopodis]|uniref:Uncharacterized protein n=1 Tax=Protopolystoma xenopodis TaxID=117903 RepID=A0A3S5CND6_9PLAT|nr:unnamed protein product [Protopolystoma xenopodis]